MWIGLVRAAEEHRVCVADGLILRDQEVIPAERVLDRALDGRVNRICHRLDLSNSATPERTAIQH
jgi:hypothetical protein